MKVFGLVVIIIGVVLAINGMNASLYAIILNNFIILWPAVLIITGIFLFTKVYNKKVIKFINFVFMLFFIFVLFFWNKGYYSDTMQKNYNELELKDKEMLTEITLNFDIPAMDLDVGFATETTLIKTFLSSDYDDVQTTINNNEISFTCNKFYNFPNYFRKIKILLPDRYRYSIKTLNGIARIKLNSDFNRFKNIFIESGTADITYTGMSIDLPVKFFIQSQYASMKIDIPSFATYKLDSRGFRFLDNLDRKEDKKYPNIDITANTIMFNLESFNQK